MSVAEALADLFFNPWRRLLLRWNWKTALLSACVRGTIFFIANLGAGLGAAIGAMGVEAALFATLAGFYGALVQAFRRAQPTWAAAMTVMILAPAVNHTLEYALHFSDGVAREGCRRGSTWATSTFLSSIITSPIRATPPPNCETRCGRATSAPSMSVQWA